MRTLPTEQLKKDSVKPARSKRRLGKGLSALIGQPVSIAPIPKALATAGGDSVTSNAARESERTQPCIVHVALEQIAPNLKQPRKSFDETILRKLAASIRSVGLIQPVLLRPSAVDPGRFELVAGERRWRAARIAGLSSIPALVHDLDDGQAAQWALVENLQRQDLNPIERAEAIAALVQEFGLTQLQVAERIGLERSSVANLLRLNALDNLTKSDVRDGRLTLGHAKALLGLSDVGVRRRIAEAAILGRWSVRELERRVEGLSTSGESSLASCTANKRPAHVIELEREIQQSVGVPVRIELRKKRNAGRIILTFSSVQQFDGIMNRLCPQAAHLGDKNLAHAPDPRAE